MSELESQYEALTSAVGIVDLSNRTKIELTGADRATLLHNLCTNDVRSLQVGSGCEAFLTNVQGKILSHLNVFCEAESLVLDTVPDQAEAVLAQLDRYLISEDVQLHNRTDEWSEFLIAGPKAESLLHDLTGSEMPQKRLQHLHATIGQIAVVIRRVDFTLQDGFLVQCESDASGGLQHAVTAAGAIACSAEVFEVARIEAGYPHFGRDITADNLPQEVARDDMTISFTKGCYLGQETVARLDALGHVNKTLCFVEFADEEVPSAGTPLSAEEKEIGQITSAIFSLKRRRPLALAFVRRGHNQPGNQLSSAVGSAEVVAFPER